MQLNIQKEMYEDNGDLITPSFASFTIDGKRHEIQADYLLGDLLDMMSHASDLTGIQSGKYQPESIALLDCLYPLTNRTKITEKSTLSDEGNYQSDVIVFKNPVQAPLEFFRKLNEQQGAWNGIEYSKDLFQAFLEFYGERVPADNVYLYKLEEGMAAQVGTYRTIDDYLMDLKEGNTAKHHCYECSDIHDAVLALMHYYASEDSALKKCERCGRWFAPVNNTLERYCRRISSQGECRTIAGYEKRAKRLENDEISKEYVRKLNTFNNRINKGSKTAAWCLAQKELLIDLYKEHRQLMKSGKITPEEMLDWLKGFNTKAPE